MLDTYSASRTTAVTPYCTHLGTWTFPWPLQLTAVLTAVLTTDSSSCIAVLYLLYCPDSITVQYLY